MQFHIEEKINWILRLKSGQIGKKLDETNVGENQTFWKNTYFLWKIYQSNSLTEISLSHFQDSEFTAYTINLPSQKCSQGLQLLWTAVLTARKTLRKNGTINSTIWTRFLQQFSGKDIFETNWLNIASKMNDQNQHLTVTTHFTQNKFRSFLLWQETLS